MSGIRAKNTRPEILVRKLLHSRGFRFRLHDASLPGKPDVVLKKYRTVIQIQGCFWHGHDCALFKLPGTRRDFWFDKIARNRANDVRNSVLLRNQQWRVLTIWECALRGKARLDSERLGEKLAQWIAAQSHRPLKGEIRSKTVKTLKT